MNTALSLAPAPLTLADRPRAVVVSFAETARVSSWAIVHGGLVDAEHVAWLEVSNAELGPSVDAREYLAMRLEREQLARAVGLLTSRRVSSRVQVTATVGAVTATCVATVGLGNALRAGDVSVHAAKVGTINVLVHIDVPLTDEGLLEASAIATEAKTAALFDANVRSRQSRALATGTGTDCTVAACPRGDEKTRAFYAGKHTDVGAAIGLAVERALSQGIAEWRKDVGE